MRMEDLLTDTIFAPVNSRKTIPLKVRNNQHTYSNDITKNKKGKSVWFANYPKKFL
jgi:hypothetical protein